ncbi:MAG: M67 family metallopeptidase [Nitrospirae bacterium]|nr:M67 family metallopeptidase [Nitrospirota bacterium]
MTEIVIPLNIHKEMIEHALQGVPEEVCGILAGDGEQVTTIYKMTNTEHSPVSYFMEPQEQFQVMKDMRNRGIKMMAIYHSHPEAQAYPSQKDVNLAFYDDVVYIIISLLGNEPVVRAFTIRDKKIEEVEVVIKQ